MDGGNWFGLILGLVFIVGAWTNWLNYYGDERDGGYDPIDNTGWVLFYIIFRKNRKAYRVFLWIMGLTMIFLSLYTCPAVEARLQSTPLT